MAEDSAIFYTIPAGPAASARRICYICTWSGLGGTETLILKHLRWLREHGFIGMVVSPSGPMSESFRGSAAHFIELTEAQADQASMTDSELVARNEQIAGLLGRREPCHFIVFNAEGLHMAADLCSHIHGSAVSVYLVFDDIFGPRKLEYLEEMNSLGMVLSMNEGCLEGHRRRYGYDLSRSVIVPLPIRLAESHYPPAPTADCVILTVARLVDMKGYVEGLIGCLADIYQGTGIPCRLIIVGDGPLREKLERTAAKSCIASRIEFVGAVPYEVLNEFYRRADIYVGMGTTLLEAASAGIPAVIATAHTSEFTTTGLFGADDALELGEPYCNSPHFGGRAILQQLVVSEKARRLAGQVGRAKVIAKFEQAVVMNEFMRVISRSAFRPVRIPRPEHAIRCLRFRRFVKRAFGYHPWVMWCGRKALLLMKKASGRLGLTFL